MGKHSYSMRLLNSSNFSESWLSQPLDSMGWETQWCVFSLAHASLNKHMSCDEFIFCLSGLWRGSLAHNDESYTPSFSSTKITAQAEMHLVHHAAQSVTIKIIYLWFLGGWHHIIYSLTAHHGWLVPDQLPASGPSDPSKVPLNDACKISLVKSRLILYIDD